MGVQPVSSIRQAASLEEIASYFKKFFLAHEIYQKDLEKSSIGSLDDLQNNFKKVAHLVETMPVRFLTNGPEAEIFEYDALGKIMRIKLQGLLRVGQAGVRLLRELLEYRINNYFRRRF
jgi:hypothetical protein